MADADIAKILENYDESFAANTWLVPGGKSRAIKHDCVERMAAKAGIVFDAPEIVSADPNNVVIIVTGAMEGIRPVWSFGEASPKNNKNQYPYAMAEKRAKDRVALKLLGLHGLVYSEEEADDFKPRANGNGQGNPSVYQQLEEAMTNATTLDALKAITIDRAGDFAALTDQQRKDLRQVYTFKAKALEAFGEAAA
jgi:hypothetical protein